MQQLDYDFMGVHSEFRILNYDVVQSRIGFCVLIRMQCNHSQDKTDLDFQIRRFLSAFKIQHVKNSKWNACSQ